jgi:hypothetical protein
MVLLWSPGSPWWAWSFAVRGRALKGKEHDEPFFTFALVWTIVLVSHSSHRGTRLPAQTRGLRRSVAPTDQGPANECHSAICRAL